MLRPGEPLRHPCRWPSKTGKLRIRLRITDLSSDDQNVVWDSSLMMWRLNDDLFCQRGSNTLFDGSGHNINMLFRLVFHAGRH